MNVIERYSKFISQDQLNRINIFVIILYQFTSIVFISFNFIRSDYILFIPLLTGHQG
jgi:hypothetical protein